MQKDKTRLYGFDSDSLFTRAEEIFEEDNKDIFSGCWLSDVEKLPVIPES